MNLSGKNFDKVEKTKKKKKGCSFTEQVWLKKYEAMAAANVFVPLGRWGLGPSDDVEPFAPGASPNYS